MTWLAHRITDTLRDWWSDPAYRDNVLIGVVASAVWAVILLCLHILEG